RPAGKGSKMLKQRHAIFLSEYLKSSDPATAAIAAGYSKIQAARRGSRLLAIPAIKAAVEEGQAKLTKKTGYDLQRCVRLVENAIEFAIQCKNANALVK